MTEFMKFRKILMITILVIIVGFVTQISFNDFSFKENKFSYISIFSAICSFIALYLSNRYEKRNS